MKITAVALFFSALASATLAIPVLSSEQGQGMYWERLIEKSWSHPFNRTIMLPHHLVYILSKV